MLDSTKHALSILAGLTLLASACESTTPYNASDGSGGTDGCDNTPGIACTWANKAGIQYNIRGGFGSGKSGVQGDGVAITNAWLYYPADLSFDYQNTPYVLDWNNHRVREVMPDGTFQTVMGSDYEGDGVAGNADLLPMCAAQGCAGDTVALNHPTGVAFMPDHSIVVAAWHDNKIRVIDAADGMTRVLTGNGYAFGGDGGPACLGQENRPKSLAIDPQGVIYFNDQVNERIRKIDIDAQRTLTSIAGNGMKGELGNGTSSPLDAEFDWDASENTPDPSGAIVLKDRTLYIADSIANVIRTLDVDTGALACVAAATATTGCPITSPLLQYPIDLEFGPDGRLYVMERDGNELDAIDLTAGTVTPVAGNGQQCDTAPPCVEKMDRPTALEVQLYQPTGFTFDQHGTIYLADTLNSRIVRIPQ